MTLDQLLPLLAEHNVQLWMEGENLRVRAPAGALTTSLREALATHKPALMSLLRDGKPGRSQSRIPLEPVPRDQPLPLSFGQERMWLMDRILGGGTTTYNVPVAVRLDGPLELDALERAFIAIVERHEVLRTTYTLQGKQVVQVISPDAPSPLTVVELGHLADAPADVQEAEVRRHVEEAARRPFDLARGPLLHALVLRLSERSHVLALTMHHIVADAWSRGIFVREYVTLYRAFFEGKPNPLPPLPIQYADFAHWHRRWIEEEVEQTQMDYWRAQLAGAPPLLELPADRPRPLRQSYRGGTFRFHIEPQVTTRIRQISQQSGATLFMTLLSAYAVLLYRYSRQTDILIGTPIANRSRPELAPLLGFFVNTLVMRLQLDGPLGFLALLERTRRTALDAYAHQDLPFEHLVDELAPERSLGHTPLFQVFFVLTAPTPRLDMPGLTITQIPIENLTAKFDLSLLFEEVDDALHGELEYNSELFDHDTAVRMAESFQTLLRAIAEDPAQDVARLPLLSAAQRKQVLALAGDFPAPIDEHAGVLRLFDAQVERTPAAPALIHDRVEWSYQELDRRATALARCLRAQGVDRDIPVAVALDRSPIQCMTLLAILKAGGAYLPLDPTYPEEWLRFAIADSRACLLITEDKHSPRFPDMPRLLVDTRAGTWGDAPESDQPLPPDDLSALAYIIYTSGSTGRPKGVTVGRSVLFNLMEWHLNKPRFAVPARTLQFSALSFDVSVQEMLSTWCTGGTLVVMSETIRRDPFAALAYARKAGITRLFLPYVALQQLAEAAASGGEIPTTLRDVATAGEQLRITPALTAMFRQLPGSVLHNQYGPTETHVCVMYPLDQQELDTWPALPPIGRPMDNVRAYVLDDQGALVPLGVPGELYLAGAALAKGYLYRPALTADRFCPDPFVAEADLNEATLEANAGARMYRTGDLARLRSDGQIEFLGRNDDQLKIRGFRVEPLEIEAVLGKAPGVADTAVVAETDRSGMKRLVGFVVPAREEAANEVGDPVVPVDMDDVDDPDNHDALVASWRRYLRAHLPEHMVPSRFVILSGFPLTPSGKVNRRGLLSLPEAAPARARSSQGDPAPEPRSADTAGRSPSTVQTADNAPGTATEQALLGYLAELLEVDRVSRDDGFFELGGTSLLAVRLVFAIRERFGIEIPLQRVFETPTVAELAAWIDAQRAPSPAGSGAADALGARTPGPLPSSILPIQVRGEHPPLFLVPPAVGSPRCYMDMVRGLGDDIPCYGLQAPGLVDANQPLPSVEALATLYIDGMRAVQPQGPYRIAGWSFGVPVAWEIAYRLEEQGQRVDLLALIDGAVDVGALVKTNIGTGGTPGLVRALARDIARMRLPSSYADIQRVMSWMGIVLPPSLRDVRHRDLRSQLRYLGGAADNLLAIMRVFAASITAARQYRPRRRSGNTLLFRNRFYRGKNDPLVAQMQAFTGAELRVVHAAGNHMSMVLNPENAQAMGSKLRAIMGGSSEPDPA